VRKVAAGVTVEVASALYVASSTPPVLQDGQSSYSALHGSAQLYSSADPDNRAWQEMSNKTFERLSNIKIAKPAGIFLSAPPNGLYHTFSASESGGHALTTPAVGDASAGGVSSSSSKHLSPDWCQAEDEDEAMLPTRKRRKGRKRLYLGHVWGRVMVMMTGMVQVLLL